MIWWLFGFAAFLAALAVIPVDLICVLGGHSLQIKVRWLGLTFGTRANRPKPPQERPATPHKPDRERHFQPGVFWHHRQTLQDVIWAALDLTRRLARSWTLRSGQVSLRVGTGDPAATGMLYGGLMAALGVLSRQWPQVQVDCQACFDKRIMELNGQFDFRSRPGILAGHLIRTAFRLPWRGLWHLRRDYASS